MPTIHYPCDDRRTSPVQIRAASTSATSTLPSVIPTSRPPATSHPSFRFPWSGEPSDVPPFFTWTGRGGPESTSSSLPLSLPPTTAAPSDSLSATTTTPSASSTSIHTLPASTTPVWSERPDRGAVAGIIVAGAGLTIIGLVRLIIWHLRRRHVQRGNECPGISPLIVHVPTEATASSTRFSQETALSRCDVLNIMPLSQQHGSLIAQRSSFDGGQCGVLHLPAPGSFGDNGDRLPCKLVQDRSQSSRRGEDRGLLGARAGARAMDSSAVGDVTSNEAVEERSSSLGTTGVPPRYEAQTGRSAELDPEMTIGLRANGSSDRSSPPPPYS
ncbi:hypothetical protein L226DRAFT_372295 [Lentinus tigrinus ALCF2SS1-7]|uniref:uncharacterized protein n=1 Tax=Lentinus tigrinus ALCF2SS1-7 TaxID=1328758 RepID=UPI001165CEC2|nr:hypothetical protein L226DRAFT_372295 [Lentinus tigrinus ALCF2SS1-7]